MNSKKWYKKIEEAIAGMDWSMIEQSISLLKKARKNGKQVFIIGNGGGAGTHFAADLFKIAGMKAICLNDNIPLVSALTNDNGWTEIYIEQLKRLMNPGDVVIAQSVHGGKGQDKAGKWSENLTKAIDYANKHNGKTISIVGFDGGELKKISTKCILISAESTPVIESFQNLVHHMIAFELSVVNRQ